MITDERVVQRWTKTGLLDKVATSNLVKVARRLDEAAERALLEIKHINAIEDEIVKMRKEGLFGV